MMKTNGAMVDGVGWEKGVCLGELSCILGLERCFAMNGYHVAVWTKAAFSSHLLKRFEFPPSQFLEATRGRLECWWT
jgi:hypothetical protein